MGVDTMEAPVDLGAEKQITNTPLKPMERTAPSPLVKQITKAGWRAGNPEGAKRMIAELEGQDAPTPPKLDLPQHDLESVVSSPSVSSEAVQPQDKIQGLQGKKEEPSLFKRIKNNAPIVAADRVGRIKEHIQGRAAGSVEVVTTEDAASPTVNVPEPVVGASEGSDKQNGNEIAAWNGFDLSQLPQQSELRDQLVNKNGTETGGVTVESKTGPAPDGFLQEQVDAFNASLEPAKNGDKPEESDKSGTPDSEPKAPDDFLQEQMDAFEASLAPVNKEDSPADAGVEPKAVEQNDAVEEETLLESELPLYRAGFIVLSEREAAGDAQNGLTAKRMESVIGSLFMKQAAIDTGLREKNPESITEKELATYLDRGHGLLSGELAKEYARVDTNEGYYRMISQIRDGVVESAINFRRSIEGQSAEARAGSNSSEDSTDNILQQIQEREERRAASVSERFRQQESRWAPLYEVWKPELKITPDQEAFQKRFGPLDSSVGQRAWYRSVQGAPPDRPAPGTTTSYKSRETAAVVSPPHIGPEAAAMRAAEDKTAATYAAWRRFADVDRLAAEAQARNARLQDAKKVVVGTFAALGLVIAGDEIVLAPGVGSQSAITSEADSAQAEIEKPASETPKPAEPIQVQEAKTTAGKESEVDGMAYILDIDHDGDSISGSWIEQKIPGIETVDEAREELSNPVVVAALLSANPEVFISNNTTTQAEIDALIARLANGDLSAVKEANEKILDHVKIGDKILTFDKAGFDELEQHFIDQVRQASTKGDVDKAAVWIKLHAELVKQKEAAMKSVEPVPYTVMTDDAASTEGQLPNVTDMPSTGVGAKEESRGIVSQIAKLFGGRR